MKAMNQKHSRSLLAICRRLLTKKIDVKVASNGKDVPVTVYRDLHFHAGFLG